MHMRDFHFYEILMTSFYFLFLLYKVSAFKIWEIREEFEYYKFSSNSIKCSFTNNKTYRFATFHFVGQEVLLNCNMFFAGRFARPSQGYTRPEHSTNR